MKFSPHSLFLPVAMGLAIALLLSSCGGGEPPASMVIVGGRVVTMDDSVPEAEAVAIRGERIVAVGRRDAMDRWIGDGTRVVDVGGRLVVPGFIDSHAHFLGLGRAMERLDLRSARTWEDLVALVREAADRTPPGEWIRGRGWHQEKWDERPEPNVDGLPFHDALSAATPDHPVLLTHASGHAVLANERAMESAGVNEATADPEGGAIVRDAEGRPIGVFRETAEDLFLEALDRDRAERSPAEMREAEKRAALAAEKECFAKGITSLHDAGESFAAIDHLRDLVADGSLRIRLYVMVNEPNDSLRARLDAYRMIGFGGDRLTVRSIKRWIDGALGSHGAWLLEPYADLPSTAGLNTEPLERMREAARIARDAGFQLCTHAIGDRANRATLDLYEEALAGGPEARERRWRIEHAQHVHPGDVPRFAALGVVAAMQGVHCTSDAPWVEDRIGKERAAANAYVWRDLVESGAVVCNGTDAPVEDVDPIPCFHATVTRRLADGSAFYPGQKLSREEALRTYTIDAAYAAFEEKIKGSITTGKLADIVVLSKDILTVPEEEILETEVVATLVGGEVVYGGL